MATGDAVVHEEAVAVATGDAVVQEAAAVATGGFGRWRQCQRQSWNRPWEMWQTAMGK